MVWHQPANEIGLPIDNLDDWLGSRERQPRIEGWDDRKIQSGIAEIRLQKDELELSALRSAAATSEAGFSWVYENARAGMTEREVQIAIEAEFFRAGAVRTAYPSIVASGPNGAYLHYFYGQDDSLNPTTRTIEKGELLLIDAGGEFGGYASDVTRTMVVGDEPTDVQSFLWQLVFRAQELAIDRCRPGEEWREVHLDSARVIGSGLVELEILRGEVDALVASGAVALFYPHGLGHLIGLTVHDAGGYPPGREPGSHPQSRYLRMDRTLEAGMITSVEPGVYFIDALLADPSMRQQFETEVVWDTVDLLRGFGGIRIEDDVHVTNGEPEVLSGAIAKPLRIG
jgi:Xaa-Pro aminopeptidase